MIFSAGDGGPFVEEHLRFIRPVLKPTARRLSGDAVEPLQGENETDCLLRNHIVYRFGGARQNISAPAGLRLLHRGLLTLYGQHSKFDKSSCAQLHVCQHACRGLWD